MSPTLRRRTASRPATRTATRWTELKASARWPISSLDRTSIGAADSASRSTCSPSWSRCTTLGSRCSAVSSAAVSSRRMGRISERAVTRASTTASTRAATSSRLYSQARRSAACLTAELVAITSALRRCSTSRIRSSLTLMTPNQAWGSTSSLGAVALSSASSMNVLALPTSGPATVSSKNSCWASVALESNWAV